MSEKMKILLLECIFFTSYICLSDAKEVRQISSLVPLDDWIDFKNRTRDVKPIDKFIGKLRATYDFVFHKADNISNVGKILDKAAEEETIENIPNISNIGKILGKAAEEQKKENIPHMNLIDLLIEKENTSKLEIIVPIDEKSIKSNLSENYQLDDGFEKNLQKLEEALPLGHLEILDDEDSADRSFDEETEQLDSTTKPVHSKFQLPYAIAQAFLRWIISLYFSTTNQGATQNNIVSRENM